MANIHIKIARGFSVLLLASAFLIAAFLTAWAGDYWTVDPKTGCQIGWVFENYSLVRASWSGSHIDGKAEGKGILTLTVRNKDGKDLQGQADAEMKAGKLDGKVTIKWSDGQYYDGFYKAGLKDGKGLYRWPDGTSYDGDWKEGRITGVGVKKWLSGIVYEGEFKNGVCEGNGVMKWPDGRVYDGEWKADRPFNSQEAAKTQLAKTEPDETESPQTGNAWIKFIFDPGVSPATRKHAQKSADITTTLLTRYGMPLVQPITAIITADTEAFFNAVISTGNMNRATAEKWFKSSLGESFGKKDTIVMRIYPIVIKGQPRQENNISETLTILSHEVFHQAARQYLKNVELNTWTWLSEGTAEYFRSMALEESRVVNVNVMLRYAEQNIQKATSIPDVHRLLDSQEYRTLARERLPVYDMSQVMVSRLVANKDFGKVASFYKLINAGTPPDKAFSNTFGIPMPAFLDEMNVYFKAQLKKVQ